MTMEMDERRPCNICNRVIAHFNERWEFWICDRCEGDEVEALIKDKKIWKESENKI